MVINGAIIKVTILITQLRGLITPLITTHEPPSNFKCRVLGFGGLGVRA